VNSGLRIYHSFDALALKEALDLYFEANNERFDLQNIRKTIIGEMKIKVS
jgi:hypothetical protein